MSGEGMIQANCYRNCWVEKKKWKRNIPKSVCLLFHHHPPCLQSLGCLHLVDPMKQISIQQKQVLKKCLGCMAERILQIYWNLYTQGYEYVCFGFGEGNFITDLSQDANKNRMMMMMMRMMMCCDWHCSHSYLATKNSIFAVMFDVEHFLNHNIFWGGSKFFLATGFRV